MTSRALFFLLAVLGIFHLWLNALLPLGVDEAHYALYGWYLDWSYFDHPPLIGWLEAPAVHAFDANWAVRLMPIALGLVVLWQLVALVRELFPDTPSLAGWVLFLALLSPLLHGLMLTPLPDLPLLLVSILLVRWLWRHRHEERLSSAWTLGLLMGLAGLSKYTAITLVVSVALVMVMYGRWHWLGQGRFWRAVALAALLLTPVLYWNALHDWASFTYQLQHGTKHADWSWERFAISQGRQLGAYGPVLYLAGVMLVVWTLLRWRSMPEGVRFLWLFAVPVWALFAWSSGHEPILPHWTALGWWLFLPVIAWWLASQRWALWLHSVLGGMAWIGLLHVVMTGAWAFKAPHPLLEVAGWEAASERLHSWQKRLQTHSGVKIHQFAGNWSLVSRPAWYLRHAEDPQVFTADGKLTQFDFWFGRPSAGSRGVVLWHSYFDDEASPAQKGLFERCRLLESQPVRWRGKDLHATFRFYDCEGWKRGRR